MKQLIAIHVIVRGDSAGKPERIAPGSSFVSEDVEADDLISRGAARLSPVQELPKEDLAEEPDAPAEVNLEKLTKAELIAHAADNGIAVDETATKASILATIQTAASELI